jgi:hypothetical protein
MVRNRLPKSLARQQPPKINDVPTGLGNQVSLHPNLYSLQSNPKTVGGLGKADFLLAGEFKPSFAPCDADFASKPGGLVHHVANAHPPGPGLNCLADFCRQFERRDRPACCIFSREEAT